MAQSNPINKRTSQLAIDPGASGDSFVQFSINGTGEFRIGVDDTDGDAFVVSQGSALGTSNCIRISAAGEITMPLNPAVLAYQASADNNVTGDGTSAVLGAGVAVTEVYDQGSDFVTSGTFTAPVTGRYLFVLQMNLRTTATTGGTTWSTKIVTSNRTYQSSFYPTRNTVAGLYGANNALGDCFSVVADMDAADTCTFQVLSSGGSKVDELINSANVFSAFNGALVA